VFGVLFLAGSLGCEGPKRDERLDLATINAGLDPGDHRIVSLVTYFGTHGIKLVHERGGWWHVTQPANPEYDVIVSLRAFPESATAEQMQNALTQINLAYLLNAPAHLAMSHPGLRGAGPGTTKEPRFLKLKATLERFFQGYRPRTPRPTS
jgi:hypothetical protein